MKTRTIAILMLAATLTAASCSALRKGAKNPVSETRPETTIQSQFLGISFGTKGTTAKYLLNKNKISYQYDSDARLHSPMDPKFCLDCEDVWFGGFHWRLAAFDFDHRDTFYQVTFYETYTGIEPAKERLREIRDLLTEKYGSMTVLFDTERALCFAEPSGRNVSVILTMHENTYTPCSVGLRYCAVDIYADGQLKAAKEL